MAYGIFLSYRRDDSRHAAGRLVDRLAKVHGRDRLFMDIDGIEPGADFVSVIGEKLAGCSIVLVVIGPHWLVAKDRFGDRRLENPSDFVRVEIETALARKVRVIPVLVDGATMPRAEDLPPSLRGLVRRNAVRLTHETFGVEADRLAASLVPPGYVRNSTTVDTRAKSKTTEPGAGTRALRSLFRILVVALQISTALIFTPLLKPHLQDLFPVARQYEIFQYAVIHTALAATIAVIAGLLSQHAPFVFSGSIFIMFLFSTCFAGATLIPDLMRAIEASQPGLRPHRWLYPLAGTILGYWLVTPPEPR